MPGYYGKLPAYGDFIGRRLPRSFIDPWDTWLQQGIARSREQLSNEWLDVYLTSPIWRFGMGPNICGETPWAGVLMPSVDKVGRYFPLSIAVNLQANVNLVRVLLDSGSWFEQAEALALSCLDEGFERESFDAGTAALGLPAGAGPATAHEDRPAPGSGELRVWHFDGRRAPGIETGLPELAASLLERMLGSYSLWATSGSERIGASLLLCEGLPPATGFAALLDGRWDRWGWSRAPKPAPSGGGDPI